ncbi:HNH endonuclease [Aeromonas hydrophila]|uniref:HNH endonuclease n=1 Tax=Aeromonas hydrophila TaxID=644 RepID=UPI001116770D|nr:HNH endonuclease [Aeromonas hydrophila]TNH91148.1 HNH endonuclease [Aeromonas hydrophila]
MASSIQKQRHRAAVNQAHRCYYCNMPMWETNPAQFSGQHQISEQQVSLLQCTGEHLHPKSEGGSNSTANIVAACKYCNQTRHKEKSPLTAPEYKRKVLSLSKKGKWHTSKILKSAQLSKSPPGKKL